jgi:hypothetical protein
MRELRNKVGSRNDQEGHVQGILRKPQNLGLSAAASAPQYGRLMKHRVLVLVSKRKGTRNLALGPVNTVDMGCRYVAFFAIFGLSL